MQLMRHASGMLIASGWIVCAGRLALRRCSFPLVAVELVKLLIASGWIAGGGNPLVAVEPAKYSLSGCSLAPVAFILWCPFVFHGHSVGDPMTSGLVAPLSLGKSWIAVDWCIPYTTARRHSVPPVLEVEIKRHKRHKRHSRKGGFRIRVPKRIAAVCQCRASRYQRDPVEAVCRPNTQNGNLV